MNKVARKLRDENNELELGLSKEANDVMTDIVVYIRSANISDLNQEIVRRDIDEMLLEGERRGQSVAEVIGDDYKAFCDSVICEVPQLTPLQRFATLVLDALLGIIIMLAIWTVFAPLRQLSSGGAWYIVTVRTSDLIEGIAIIAAAFFIVGYICKNSFKPKKAVFAVGIIGETPLLKSISDRIRSGKGERFFGLLRPVLLCGVLLLVTAYLVDGSFNPFLYFRF